LLAIALDRELFSILCHFNKTGDQLKRE
jgi:hypothetical protein